MLMEKASGEGRLQREARGVIGVGEDLRRLEAGQEPRTRNAASLRQGTGEGRATRKGFVAAQSEHPPETASFCSRK